MSILSLVQRRIWLVCLTVCILMAMSIAHAKEVADFSLDETSGPLASSIAGSNLKTSSGLADAKDYGQSGPPAGSYGTLVLNDAAAAAMKSTHFDGKTKLDLGPAKESPLNVTGDFTVAAWVKFDQTDGYHILLATGAGSGNGWKFGINDGNLVLTANGVTDVTEDDFTVEAGKWMHVALAVAGTKGERKINFFVNGKKINAEPLTCDDITASDVAQMHLGGADNATSTDEYFVGNLADLKVYDNVLDAAAIKAAATPSAK